MKKVLTAWIEQVLEFSTLGECEAFVADVERTGKKYKVLGTGPGRDGAVKLHIRRQYNKNAFPDG